MNKSIRRILIGTVLFLMGVMILLAILILTKTVCINKMFVSDDDIIGVDVSEYQDKIDMKRLSEQNIDFVYIRATEGSSYQDACFRENWKNAHECGLPAGAYHFFSFDSSGETQARNYIETVGELEGDLIPVVDFEYYGDKEKNRPDKKFREIMNMICNLGGDTDTNCCIVGAVIGPLIGMKNFGFEFKQMLDVIPPSRPIYSVHMAVLFVLYLNKSNRDNKLIMNDKYFLQQLLTMIYGNIDLSY